MTQLTKTIIEIEVLSDEPYNPACLEEVASDIMDGGCSGNWRIKSQEVLTKEEMANALEAQGSDPAFLLGEDC